VNAALGPPASSSSTSVARSRTCRQEDWEKDVSATALELRLLISFSAGGLMLFAGLAANGLGQRGEFELNMDERIGNL
jgi:hypothetical protein